MRVDANGRRGSFSGLGGRLAGWMMSVLNQPMNEIAFELLELCPHDAVLEIGFGPGRLIERLARDGDVELVAGVDPSPAMVSQARRRNRRWIGRGRVRLLQGSVSRLPFEDCCFTKACAVNSYQFWSDPVADLREVRRVLRLGGRLVLCLRTKDGGRLLSGLGFTDDQVETVRDQVLTAGFREACVERRPGTAAVVARR
jgi:SAM-dependent methyltransferase